jgi:hypothetical protein
MGRRPFTDAHPNKIRSSSYLKPAVAGTVARHRAGCAPVVRPFAAASSVAVFSFLLLGGGFVGSQRVVGNFFVHRAAVRRGLNQWASVLSRRTGALRLLAPGDDPPSIAIYNVTPRCLTG